ncbi:MAG: dihydrofolate reductase [Dysgonamonadaceae bacterium]|nr:dihydrofolate reductase [Dysgonamonadaceae bacterium]
MAIISIIAAAGTNNEIGRQGGLLCHLPSDLKHFKAITSGHTIIMGRKTFESLPAGSLPNRRNIIISRNKDLQPEKAEVFPSLDYAQVKLMNEEEVFIIGGAQIYRQAIEFADKIYLTRIFASFPDADVFFPEIDKSVWKEIARETFMPDKDSNSAVAFSFVEYIRK